MRKRPWGSGALANRGGRDANQIVLHSMSRFMTVMLDGPRLDMMLLIISWRTCATGKRFPGWHEVAASITVERAKQWKRYHQTKSLGATMLLQRRGGTPAAARHLTPA